jgi:hypothetical protein
VYRTAVSDGRLRFWNLRLSQNQGLTDFLIATPNSWGYLIFVGELGLTCAEEYGSQEYPGMTHVSLLVIYRNGSLMSFVSLQGS